MWFRNLKIYRIANSRPLDLNAVITALAARALTPCGKFDMVSRGWIYPRDQNVFVHDSTTGHWLLALGVEQKLLPATVIRQTARERAEAIEAEQGRKVGRKEMREIVERVTEELLPKAFRQRRTTWAWLDPINGWLAIDAGSDARADEFVETLIATLENVALRPLQTQLSPYSAMTGWLGEDEAPAGFSLDSDLELRSMHAAQSAIRYVHHDIGGPEVAGHIGSGKVAVKLGMTWNDRVSFVLTDKLHIKRLAFLDIVKEQAEMDAETAEDLFASDFALMTGELDGLLKDLVKALGGEVAA